VDDACRDVGRDPAEIRRTVAVHVRLPGGHGRTMGDTTTTDRIVPLEGSPERMADELRAYAGAGVDEVQAVLDPIDRAAIERFAAVLPPPDFRTVQQVRTPVLASRRRCDIRITPTDPGCPSARPASPCS